MFKKGEATTVRNTTSGARKRDKRFGEKNKAGLKKKFLNGQELNSLERNGR